MAPLSELGRRVWMLAHRRRVDRELDEEMRLHHDLLAQRRGAAGPQPADARLVATREFGSPLRIREATHDAIGWRAIEDAARDVRYGARSLVRNQSFAAAGIATLALGIGATAAIFSLVNGVVFKPLPFAQPERLVQMYGTPAVRGEAVGGLDRLRSQSTSFDALVGYNISARYLQSADGPERVMAVSAEREFFSMLGVAPLAGRGFRPDDPSTVAVVSEQFWRRVLGARSTAIGSTLALNDMALTVIGIMPDRFQFPYGAASVLHSVTPQGRTDLWIPFDPPADPSLRGGRFGYVTGRLKPTVSITEAESELAVISRRMEAEDPGGYRGRGVRLEPLSEAVVPRPIKQSLFALFASVVVVLALAAANVANLSLVHMTLRRREIAVRAALGAGPVRLVRQFLTESLLLSLAGGLVGLVIAWWATEWLTALASSQLPRAWEIGIDLRAFSFLLLTCVVVGVLIGLIPAAVARRADTRRVLHTSVGQAARAGGLPRLRDALVVGEIACAFVLTAAAASLVRELVTLRNTDTGMATSNVITFHLLDRPPSVGIVRRGPPPEIETRPLYQIADRVGQIPGVRAAGFTQVLPLQNWGWSANSIDFRVRGRSPLEGPPFTFDLRYVTPGYFEALGMPIRRGRGFTARDTRDAPPVIVVNETLARRVFGDADPVGQETTRGAIVGVVGDIRNVNLDQETIPELYYPIAQNWSQLSELGMTLVVRTLGPPGAVVETVRAAVRAVNPGEAIFDVKTMDRVVEESLASFTLYVTLLVIFGVLALVLALTGTYGVMAYVAASRAREFAVRVALGAERSRIMRLVFRQGLVLTSFGLVIGAAVAMLASPVLRALPGTVGPPGLPVLGAAAVLIGLVAMAACLMPARRAAAVNPMATLRSE
jgi:putative ABC transport system permease protein